MYIVYILFCGLLVINTSYEVSLNSNKLIRSTNEQVSRNVTYDLLCANECDCSGSKVSNFSTTLKAQLTNVELKISFSPRFRPKLIFCTNQNITNLPKFENRSAVTPGLNIIIFVHGMLTSVKTNSFEAVKDSIEYIDLSHNSISSVAGDSFKNLKYLQEIDLRFNNLAYLGGKQGHDPFIGLGPVATLLPNIRLRGNPLKCTCTLEYIRKYRAILPSNDATSCFIEDELSKEKWISIEVLHSLFSCPTQPEQPTIKGNNLKHSQRKVLHSEVTGFQMRQLSIEEKHHVVDNKLNISVAHGVAGERESHAHVVVRKGQPDYPLLLTMFVWFFMIYFGITRFIKTNDAARDSNTKYYMDIPEPEKRNEQ